VCRKLETTKSTSRSQWFQRSLSSMVLPHTFRIGTPALAPAHPSAVNIPGTPADVEESVAQTLLASIGVLAMRDGA
jgi:hypothetical protein